MKSGSRPGEESSWECDGKWQGICQPGLAALTITV